MKKLPLAVKSLDELPEPLRKEYKRDGDLFVLDLVLPPGDNRRIVRKADVEAMKTELAEIRAANKKTKAEIAEREAQIESLRAERPASTDDAAIQARADEIVAEHQAKIDAKVAGWEKKRAVKHGQLEDVLVGNAIHHAASEHGASAVLLSSVMRDRLTITETKDGYDVVVLDAEGAVRTHPSGAPITPSEAVRAFRQSAKGTDFAPIFKPLDNDHSVPIPREPARTPKHRGDFASMADKVAFIKRHGEAGFAALPGAPKGGSSNGEA